MKLDLLTKVRNGEKMSLQEQIMLVIQLSIPAIMAQISSIVMQYIDASMVGRLGANDSASIGLISSSTWLFGGMCTAAIAGFTVQVAQYIGAKKEKEARNVMKQAYIAALGFSILMALIGTSVSPFLPKWLGGNPDIVSNSTKYFFVFAAALPLSELNYLSSGFLQASGNMKLPSMLHIVMCFLDVIFNTFFIFDSFHVFGMSIKGLGLGVLGAALGTASAHIVIALIMTYCVLKVSPVLAIRREEKLVFHKEELIRSVKISVPVAIEQIVMSGAQVLTTRIIAPLGTIAIAANSFAVTAESLCYMPGYGIQTAAATLIGQSIGAKRDDLTRYFGWLTTIVGMLVMAITGIMMFFAAPFMMGLLSPVPEVIELGTKVLRIEVFAEPLFAASIVAGGVFRGAGDTLVPTILNFASMWLVRITLSAFLSPILGLSGAWIAMCVELCVRGILFLLRLKGKKWMKTVI